MSRYFVLVLILLMASCLPGAAAFSQDETPLSCSSEELQTAIREAGDLLQLAAKTTDSEALTLTIQAKTRLATLNSQCLGFDFAGTGPLVSDPVYLPEGLYRVTAETDGVLMLNALPVEGKCNESLLVEGKFQVLAVTMNPGPSGAQALLISQGCTVVWETAFVSAPYTVTFEKMQ